jgi:hypothetical protein
MAGAMPHGSQIQNVDSLGLFAPMKKIISLPKKSLPKKSLFLACQVVRFS